MAAGSLAVPIKVWKVLGAGDAQPQIRRLPEDDAETFKEGTPVMVDRTTNVGYLIANPAITSIATAVIAGFSLEAGSNLTTRGVPKTLTYGSVPNQASAVIIPIGAPLNDGKCGVALALDTTLFKGRLKNGQGSDHTLVVTDLLAKFGLTIDTNGYWMVDSSKSTAAGGACVEIVEFIDPVGTVSGLVAFRVTTAAQQFGGNPTA